MVLKCLRGMLNHRRLRLLGVFVGAQVVVVVVVNDVARISLRHLRRICGPSTVRILSRGTLACGLVAWESIINKVFMAAPALSMARLAE